MRGGHGQAQHHARDRGADFEPVDLFGQSAAAFRKLQGFVAHVAQLVVGIFAPGRLDLQDLQLGFGGLAFGLRMVGLHFAPVAGQPCRFAFEVHDAGGLGQAFVKQSLLNINFGLQQPDLIIGRGHLGGDALTLRGDLIQPLLQLVDLGFLGFTAGDEKPLLTFDLFSDIGSLGCDIGQLFGKYRRCCVITFCLQPGFAGHRVEQLAFDDGKVGFDLSAIQPDQNVAGFDSLRLLHVDLGHHTAIRVLDDLAVLFDLNNAIGDDGTGNIGEQAPAAKEHHEQYRGDQTGPDRSARGPGVGVWRRGDRPFWCANFGRDCSTFGPGQPGHRGLRQCGDRRFCGNRGFSVGLGFAVFGHDTPPCAGVLAISAWFCTMFFKT